MDRRLRSEEHADGARPFVYRRSGRRSRELMCNGVPMRKLAREYATPLYVYSADAVLERVGMFAREFADVRHTVCYAVKANSNVSLLKLLAKHGCGFDIVSGGELERVLMADRKAAVRVLFSGVGKTAEEMDLALDAGIRIFNAESEAELLLLAERAANRRKRARVALRVNPDVFAETHPYISTGLREHKFGVEIGAAREIYRRAAREKWLLPVGVSVHIGSQIRSVEPFEAALRRVMELIGQLQEDGVRIESIDAGGGLGIEYHASKEFRPAAKVHEYAAALKRALAGADGGGGFKGELLLEPGRFIIAQAGALLTRVLYVKRNGAKTFVVTDAGMNDLIRPSLYQAFHEIVPVELKDGQDGPGAEDEVDVVGPVCETGDFFARDRMMPEVQPGDLLAVLDAGAYGMSLASNYNSRPRAAEVMVEGKKARLVRRRETVKEMLAAERV